MTEKTNIKCDEDFFQHEKGKCVKQDFKVWMPAAKENCNIFIYSLKENVSVLSTSRRFFQQ